AEVVDVAARRIGLRCVWKRINVDAAQALREGQIDIFPDLTDLPSRRDGKIHFSAPWLQNEYCLLKLKNTNLNNIEGTRNRTISFFGRFVLETVVRRYLPGIQPLRVGSTESALEAVCTGEAAAVVLEYRAAKAMMLERPPLCGSAPFSFVPMAVNAMMGVGSTLEAASAADAIRDELGAMARGGELGPIFAKWSYASAAESRAIFAVMDAETRTGRLLLAVIALLALLGFSFWQAHRSREAWKLAE